MGIPEPSKSQQENKPADLEQLYSRFITPIEDLRSISESPWGTYNRFTKKEILQSVIISGKCESRGHAFLRMLGFPVVGGSGFYNSGFGAEKVNESIAEKIDSFDLLGLHQREQWAKDMRELFSKQSLGASVYSLAMAVSPKPFSIQDEKTLAGRPGSSIVGRGKIIGDLLADAHSSVIVQLGLGRNELNETPLGYFVDQIKHYLKPYMIDPLVELVIQHTQNRICVPFLADKTATRVSASPERFLLRPGIELIIRKRLADSVISKEVINNIKGILDKQKKNPPKTVDNSISVVEALSDIKTLTETQTIETSAIDDILSKFSNVQLSTTEELIGNIKFCVELLKTSVKNLDEIRSRITFIPVPDKKGPEFGGTVIEGAGTELEQKIRNNEIVKAAAEFDLQKEIDLGNFASPFANVGVRPVDKKTTQEITKLVEKRNTSRNDGLKYIRNIEIITGEVSGLGLVDILAIYTALWSIDIEHLLNLLDEESFARLYKFNPELRTDPVKKRKDSSPPDIKKTIKKIEEKVDNILAYADSLLGNS